MFDNKSQREVQKLKQNSHIFYDFCVNISPLLVDRGTQDGKDSFSLHQQLCSNYSKQQSSSRARTCHPLECRDNVGFQQIYNATKQS